MNSIAVRCAVAIVFLVFAWKGSALDMSWSPRRGRDVIQPPNELLEWGKPLSTVLPRMTPADRIYLAAFYDAMAHILITDGDRADPILSDTEKFAAFHAGSLRLAVNKKDVGK